MNKKKSLAYMYDFYNKHMLHDQNDDIQYYKNQIKHYNSKNVLIVGAGTGRVAIPLSDIANVIALDFDEARLEVLREKSKNLKTICCDIKIFDTKEYFDMIVFPYSTIQFSNNEIEIDRILKQLIKIISTDTIILFDISKSFESKQNQKNILLFKDYSEEVKDNVSVYYSAKRYDKYIEFNVNYNIEQQKIQLLETEQYYYHNEKMFNKLLKNNNLKIIKIDYGYGNKNFTHKHIYHVKLDSR